MERILKEMSKKKPVLFKKANIKQQLYSIYFLAVFLPITILGIFLLLNTSNLLTSYHRDLLKSDNLRMKTILFEITTQVYNISEDLAFHNGIRDVISGSYYINSSLEKKIDDISVVDHYRNNYAEIDGIEIYTDNPAFMNYKQFYRADETIRSTDWYQKAINQSSVFWVPMSSKDKFGNEYWNLCLIRKIQMIDSNYSGVLVIKISDNYLRTRVGSQEYSVKVSVDGGPIFYSTNRENYGVSQMIPIDYEDNYYEYEGYIKEGRNKFFVEFSTLSLYQSDSKMYICTANEQAYHNIRRIYYISFIIILIALLLPAMVVHYFTYFFTSRIQALRQAMHQASNEDYEIVNSVQGQDEVSEAFSDLEIMVQKIKRKDAQMYEARISEQELISEQQAMEFKMLSSQINPHFLYNTLETIRMKAFTAGDREVATAIKLLGKSLRYVLENTGTAFTTLSEELSHVKTYLSIQELRFGDKFESSFEIAKDIDTEHTYILPLLLQPVVENAILHGLEEKETGGKIQIIFFKRRSEQEDHSDVLFIDLGDNGCGMDEEELGKLRNQIEVKDVSRNKSIGLYNINQRMKLSYGNEYGIKIDSMPGKGTTVHLILPLCDEKCVK